MDLGLRLEFFGCFRSATFKEGRRRTIADRRSDRYLLSHPSVLHCTVHVKANDSFLGPVSREYYFNSSALGDFPCRINVGTDVSTGRMT